MTARISQDLLGGRAAKIAAVMMLAAMAALVATEQLPWLQLRSWLLRQETNSPLGFSGPNEHAAKKYFPILYQRYALWF